MNYKNVLTIGVSQEGLYLAVVSLFRFMHPPLLVPWSEVRVRRSKGWFFEYVTFTMGHELAIPLRIRGNLAVKLQSAAGNHWPVEEAGEMRRGFEADHSPDCAIRTEALKTYQ